MKIKWIEIWISTILLLMTALFSAPACFGKGYRLLVLQPTIHAGSDLSFLEKGVVDMLTGRLATAGETVVVTLTSDEKAPSRDVSLAKAKALGADYVVMQSITVLGNKVSTDAHVLETSTGKTALTFSRAGDNQADIINHVDELAEQINTRLLGRGAAATMDQAAKGKPGDSKPAARTDIHQHPEKLLHSTGEGLRDTSVPYAGGGATSNGRLLMRGRRLERQIRGVTSGDVDGDGSVDIVCIDSRTILAYSFQQGRLIKMAQAEAGKANVGVDAADLNANGKDELFVTHFDNDSGKVLSYVLEWDGKKFQRTADNLRWYFRSVDLDAHGRILVGQRQGIDDRFGRGVYEIEYTGGTYEGGPKLALPRSRNVFGFARGAVRSAGNADLVDYSSGGCLRVKDHKGREEWASVESYGGTVNALIVKSKDDPKERDYYYMPSRVHLIDLDGDGLQEVVAVRNDDMGGAFSQTRLFKQGRLEILKWDQLGLMSLWRTRGVAKFIGDFTVTDINGDGTPEIVAAIVQKARNVLGAGRSYLAVFSLDSLAAGEK